MIATVTLNPCLDKYITVAHLELNETNRSETVQQYAGGKGLDVSRAIHEMRGDTMAFGLVGGHEGKVLAMLLAEEGVPFNFVPVEDETRSCFIITDAAAAQQIRISTPGPNIKDEAIGTMLEQLWALNPGPDMLVCGGSVPPSSSADIYAQIIDKARRHGIRTILDSSGEYLKQGVKARPYLIKPNVLEAQELLGTKLAVEKEIVEAGHRIVGMGIEIAVISRGRDGLIAVSQNEVIKAVPPEVTVASTVGAGDCAVAGLALKLSAGETLSEACRLAVAMGTAAVLQPGTGLARRADVERLLSQIRLETLPNPPA